MTLGRRIKVWCEESNITHREFADLAGISEIAVSNLVRKEKLPSFDALKGIAKIFDCAVSDLLVEHFEG